jgi:(2Fe-2S) ferredoxin
MHAVEALNMHELHGPCEFDLTLAGTTMTVYPERAWEWIASNVVDKIVRRKVTSNQDECPQST